MMNPEPTNAENRPAQQTANPDDSPWWLKHATRFVGTSSSLIALALGVTACITITPACLLAGILQMLCGLAVALIEAPCFCMFLDFAQAPSQFFERKPHWYRAILYVAMSIMPIALCRGFSTFFGSGMIFVTGCLYGVLALGKKAPASEMRAKASSSYNLLSNAAKPAADIETGNAAPNQPQMGRPSGGAI